MDRLLGQGDQPHHIRELSHKLPLRRGEARGPGLANLLLRLADCDLEGGKQGPRRLSREARILRVESTGA